MNRSVVTIVIAGTALGMGSVAFAQSASQSDNLSTDLDLERAYAAELAADAASRSSLLQGASDGSGFQLTNGNGDSTLNINALFQFRYTASFRDDDSAFIAGDNDFTHGFEIPRARIDLSGNLVNDQISYRISGDFGEINNFAGFASDNDFTLTYAFVQYDFEFLEGSFVRLGQFKLPLFYTELVAPEFQVAAERSLTNEFFSQQYSQGVMIGYETDAFAASVSFSNGVNSAGTSFDAGGQADLAVTARVDGKFQGDWAQFADLSSFRNNELAIRLGGAFHYELFGETNPTAGFGAGSGSFGAFGISEGDLIQYTADIQIEGNGWAVFGAFYGQNIQDDSPGGTVFAGGEDEADDFGAVVQGSFFVTDNIELFARWDAIFLDDNRFAPGTTAEDNLHFLTVGGTYYFIPESHAIKWTNDVVISFEDTSALVAGGLLSGSGTTLPGATGSGGALGSVTTGLLGQDEDTEIVFRSQLSVLF